MSGIPANLYNHASVQGSDQRLDEWSQIQLAPLRGDRSWSHDQSHHPYISQYATDAYPIYASPFDAQNRNTTGHVS